MKFLLAILTVLAVTNPLETFIVPRTRDGALADELQKFVDLIPIKETIKIVYRYKAEDIEFQQVLEYFQSYEFKILITEIENISEWIQILNYAESAGLDAYYLVNKITNDFLYLLKPSAQNRATRHIGGIRGFLDEVEDLIPIDKLRSLYLERVANSAVFADFNRMLGSPIAQGFVNKVCANINFNNFLRKAKNYGVRLDIIRVEMEERLGLTIPC